MNENKQTGKVSSADTALMLTLQNRQRLQRIGVPHVHSWIPTNLPIKGLIHCSDLTQKVAFLRMVNFWTTHSSSFYVWCQNHVVKTSSASCRHCAICFLNTFALPGFWSAYSQTPRDFHMLTAQTDTLILPLSKNTRMCTCGGFTAERLKR